jgi:LacI family transcriptional regulator
VKTRVTQSDIAHAAGVHNTTVSLALRNSPALPEETRLKIQSIAKAMGYCPDPMLQALVAYRTGQAQKQRQQSIAYITNWKSNWGWRDVPAEFNHCLGAERKASQSGYRLEHFSLAEPGMTEKRLNDMLYHRGIRGVLFASQAAEREALTGMDWSRLSAVKIGLFPKKPALCRVMSDDYGALRNGIRKIIEAGYQRIGLVLPRRDDDLADQAWSSAFLIEQSLSKSATLLPILYREAWPQAAIAKEFGSGANLASLERWVSIHQPDAIIGFSADCLRDLNTLGLSVPRDVAFADLSVNDGGEDLAGLQQDGEKAGEIAVELLLNQMERNLYGVPSNATTTLVETTWRPGASLPVKTEVGVPRRRAAVHTPLLSVRKAV